MERFVRFFLVLSLFLGTAGCASVVVPHYIQDKNPYKRQFYASFDKTLEAVLEALQETGWRLEQKTDPSVYERSEGTEFGRQQILLITETRQIGLLVGTRYARLNIYVRAGSGNVSEVEIRYLSIKATPIKGFHDYKHDRSVERLFLYIEDELS